MNWNFGDMIVQAIQHQQQRSDVQQEHDDAQAQHDADRALSVQQHDADRAFSAQQTDKEILARKNAETQRETYETTQNDLQYKRTLSKASDVAKSWSTRWPELSKAILAGADADGMISESKYKDILETAKSIDGKKYQDWTMSRYALEDRKQAQIAARAGTLQDMITKHGAINIEKDEPTHRSAGDLTSGLLDVITNPGMAGWDLLKKWTSDPNTEPPKDFVGPAPEGQSMFTRQQRNQNEAQRAFDTQTRIAEEIAGSQSKGIPIDETAAYYAQQVSSWTDKILADDPTITNTQLGQGLLWNRDALRAAARSHFADEDNKTAAQMAITKERGLNAIATKEAPQGTK